MRRLFLLRGAILAPILRRSLVKNKSVMQHAFSMIPSVAKPRSVFDRSHGYKTTLMQII